MIQNPYQNDDFKTFISPLCNRQQFIQQYLNRYGIDAPVISLNGKNHIYVKFPVNQYNPMYRIKTVLAHYDRFPGSAGANDNSAAVFCMLNWAVKLSNRKTFHNIRLVFTDGEEMGDGGVAEQGAYELALLFKKLGIEKGDVFVFDSMGRGTVPVICDTKLPEKISRKFLQQYESLQNRAASVLTRVVKNKWFTFPSGFSDNAGFIVNGIPAVALTMLPESEVEEVLYNPQKVPLTWQMFHTREDNLENLTPESYEVFAKILDEMMMLV